MRQALVCVFVGGFVLCALAQEPSAPRVVTPNRPLPALSTITDFSAVVRAKLPAVYAVGHPDRGYANGFCIHRSARLLVTAAHVADYKYEHGSLYAGSYGGGPNAGTRYRVTRVWYFSPADLRESPGPNYKWGAGPDFGTVVAGLSADVAILQLEGHERGEPLPAAFTLFEEKEGEDPGYVGRVVGQIWFKGDWTPRGDRIEALVERGIIRSTSVIGSSRLPRSGPNEFLNHTLPSPHGSSGSPVFLSDGRVVGVLTGRSLVPEVSGGTASNAFWIWALILSEPELRKYFNPPANASKIRKYLALANGDEYRELRENPRKVPRSR